MRNLAVAIKCNTSCKPGTSMYMDPCHIVCHAEHRLDPFIENLPVIVSSRLPIESASFLPGSRVLCLDVSL